MTKIVGSGGGDVWWTGGASVGGVWTLTREGLLEINWEEQVVVGTVQAAVTGAPHALGIKYVAGAAAPPTISHHDGTGAVRYALFHFTSGLMLETFVDALRTVAADVNPGLEPPRKAGEIDTLVALEAYFADPPSASGSEFDYINATVLLQPQLEHTGEHRVEWADDVTLDGDAALMALCPSNIVITSAPPKPHVIHHIRLGDLVLVKWDPNGVDMLLEITGAASPRHARHISPCVAPTAHATLKLSCTSAAHRKSLHSKLFAAYWNTATKPLPSTIGSCTYTVRSPSGDGGAWDDAPARSSASPDRTSALYQPAPREPPQLHPCSSPSARCLDAADGPAPRAHAPAQGSPVVPPFAEPQGGQGAAVTRGPPRAANGHAPAVSTPARVDAAAVEDKVATAMKTQLDIEIARKEAQYEVAMRKVKLLHRKLASATAEVDEMSGTIQGAKDKFGAKWNCLMALGGAVELNQWVKCEMVERACLDNSELTHRLRLIAAFTKATRVLALSQRTATGAALSHHLQVLRTSPGAAGAAASPLELLAPTGILPEPLLLPVDEFLGNGTPMYPQALPQALPRTPGPAPPQLHTPSPRSQPSRSRRQERQSLANGTPSAAPPASQLLLPHPQVGKHPAVMGHAAEAVLSPVR